MFGDGRLGTYGSHCTACVCDTIIYFGHYGQYTSYLRYPVVPGEACMPNLLSFLASTLLTIRSLRYAANASRACAASIWDT